MALRKRGLLSPADGQQVAAAVHDARLRDARELRGWLLQSLLPQAWIKVLYTLVPKDAPTAFGSSVCLCHLAQGGMGEIWLAHRQDQLVVVKTVRREFSGNREFIKRFQREARILQKISDEHVVSGLDEGLTHDRLAFLVLEAVPGPDLKVLVKERQGLSEVLALRYARDASRGLAVVHQLGLIHRDLKPANILIDEIRDQAKLSDFGIARSTQQDRSRLTQAGGLMGSHNYMAPEQARGRDDLDIRSDIYGLGCVLFFALANRAPFLGTVAEILAQHSQEAPPDIRSLNPYVSGDTAAIIQQCLAKPKELRFSDPTALTAALEASLAHQDLAVWRSPSKRSAPGSGAALNSETLLETQGEDLILSESASQALGDRRIFLRGINHPACVVLCAGKRIVMGKLLGAGVDFCLRQYPIAAYREHLQRLSRRHLALAWNDEQQVMMLEDLHARNGTWTEGNRLPKGCSTPLNRERVYDLNLAQVLRLSVCCHAVSSSCPSASETAVAAVTIHRPDNRSELSYALVLDTLTVGSTDSHLPIARATRTVTLGFREGDVTSSWCYRFGSEPWQPLSHEATVNLGGVQMQACIFDEGHLADDP